MARWIAGTLAVVCVVTAASAAEDNGAKLGYAGGLNYESADGAHRLKVSNRVQVRFTHLDPDEGDSEGSFRIRRYKFKIDGQVFEDWKFELQVNFASGSVEGDNDALLEDAWLQYTRHHWVQPWIGQGKAWFGRQLLTSSGKLQFVDRSLAGNEFAANRQTGIGIVGRNEAKTFEYNVGMYNGEGINRTSNPGNDYLTVGRVVFTPFGEVALSESAFEYPDSSKLAIGAALYDNTFQPVEDTDLVVVIDPDTGLPTGDVDEIDVIVDPETDVQRLGLEFVYKLRGFSAFAEYFDETAEPLDESDVDRQGYYAQAGWLFPNRHAEVALRFSEILPDVTPSADRSEARVAFSWYFQQHDYKIQADYGWLASDAGIDTGEFRTQAQFIF